MKAGTTRYALFKQSWRRCALVDQCLSSALQGGQSLYCWYPSRRSKIITYCPRALLRALGHESALWGSVFSGVKVTAGLGLKQAVILHSVTCGLKWGFNACFLVFVFSSKGAWGVPVSRMQMWVVLARRFRNSGAAHKDWIEIPHTMRFNLHCGESYALVFLKDTRQEANISLILQDLQSIASLSLR